MGRELKRAVGSRQLGAALGLEHRGPDAEIRSVAAISEDVEGSLVFAKDASFALGRIHACVIASRDVEGASTKLLSGNPRFDFIRALLMLEQLAGFRSSDAMAVVDPSAVVGENVVFGRGVVIGPRTVIGSNVVIGEDVRIGADCRIRSCAVIGEDGFGYERDPDGTPVRMVHLGSVSIGDRVEIGNFTAVCRGTLGPTIIEDDVKIDNLVHVAHNVTIRRCALVIACAELSGGVEVGERAWVAPGVSVIQKRRIGADSVVGIGAVVVKDVAAGSTVVGNPAKPLERE